VRPVCSNPNREPVEPLNSGNPGTLLRRRLHDRLGAPVRAEHLGVQLLTEIDLRFSIVAGVAFRTSRLEPQVIECAAHLVELVLRLDNDLVEALFDRPHFLLLGERPKMALAAPVASVPPIHVYSTLRPSKWTCSRSRLTRSLSFGSDSGDWISWATLNDTGTTVPVSSASGAFASRIRWARPVSRRTISAAVFLRGNSPKNSSMYWISSAPCSRSYCVM